MTVPSLIALALAVSQPAAAQAAAQPAAAPSQLSSPQAAQPGAPATSQPAVAEALARPAVAPLTLEQAIALSLERNYDQRRVELTVAQIEQDRLTARAAILPRLDFNASATETALRGGNVLGTQVINNVPVTLTADNQTYPSYFFQLQVQQLIFDGGKWWNNLAAADANLAANHANVEEQRLNTRYLTEQKFFELLRAQKQLQVLGEAAARSRDQADFTQRLFEGGRATQADVYQARANRDNDEVNRLGQEARVELARQDLAQQVGVDPAEPLTVVEPSFLQQEPAVARRLSELVQEALSSRPSLKAFGLFVEAQRKALSAARGAYYPALSANAGYVRSTRDFGDVSANFDKVGTYSVGLSLNWNLFQGFSTDAAVKRQEVQVLLSENDLQNGRRGVASDVERAVASLSGARAQALVAAQAMETANEGLRLARTRQQVGVGTQLEVRDAELKLTQSQIARVNSLLDGREAESALRRAIGG